MSNSLPYYPRYPRDFFEGTAGMSLEEKGAYGLVLDLIYMMGARGLPDDAQYIAGQLGTSVRKWNSLRKSLIERGKLTSDKDIISNKRADDIKIKQRLSQDNKAENARGPRKNKDLPKLPQTYQEEPEPKEETKVSSSQEVAGYQDYLEAHPNRVDSDAGRSFFSALVDGGTDAAKIIAAAVGYAETVKGWSDEAKVQQSDNFLCPNRGKWEQFAASAKPAPVPRATEAERLTFWAREINGTGYVASSAINVGLANSLLDARLVTPEKLKERGIAA